MPLYSQEKKYTSCTIHLGQAILCRRSGGWGGKHVYPSLSLLSAHLGQDNAPKGTSHFLKVVFQAVITTALGATQAPIYEHRQAP